MSQADNVFRTWEAIAAFLEMSEKTARKKSRWGVEGRVPVWEDHRGPIARKSELERWKADQLLPYGVRDRMRRDLSRQVPSKGKTKAQAAE